VVKMEKRIDISQKVKTIKQGELIPWEIIDKLAPIGKSQVKVEILFIKKSKYVGKFRNI